MQTKLALGIAALTLIGVAPATAQQGAQGAHAAGKVHTRADVQAKVTEHFGRIDSNRDGFVTKAEAQAARGQLRARRADRSNERRLRAFDRLDSDNDGSISRAEWDVAQARRQERVEARRAGGGERRALRHMRRLQMGALHGRMFAMADANNDQRVSLQEATAAALRHFDMADANRDGRITREERRQMRRQMNTERRPG